MLVMCLRVPVLVLVSGEVVLWPRCHPVEIQMEECLFRMVSELWNWAF